MLKASIRQGDSSSVETRYGYATFHIQWDDIIPDNQHPKTLRYCFYPSGNGAMIQTEGDSKSLRIALPSDTYKLIIFNSDAGDLRFHYMNNFEIAEAFIPSGYREDNKPLIPLYATVVDNVTINSTEERDYSVSLKSMVQHIFLKINLNDTQGVKSCEASLSGVASSLNFSTRNIGVSSRVIVPFNMEKIEDGFVKDLVLLDVLPEALQSSNTVNHLKLDFIMKDGRTVTSTVDLGKPLAQYDRQNILIEVDASIERSTCPSIVFSNWEVKGRATNLTYSLL